MSNFKEMANEVPGQGRYVRNLSDRFWVSVLYRMTGFGYPEWETAIVRVRDDNDPEKYKHGKWDDRECLIVRGDHREELEDKTEQEIMEWYAAHSHGKNSFETLMGAIQESSQQEAS